VQRKQTRKELGRDDRRRLRSAGRGDLTSETHFLLMTSRDKPRPVASDRGRVRRYVALEAENKFLRVRVPPGGVGAVGK
jgi:hypothetical protein